MLIGRPLLPHTCVSYDTCAYLRPSFTDYFDGKRSDAEKYVDALFTPERAERYFKDPQVL